MRRGRPRQPKRQVLRRRVDGGRKRAEQRRQRLRTRTMTAPTRSMRLIEADAWIEQAVGDVGQQVHRHVGDGNQQDASLDERVVAKRDRLNEQSPDARPRKDGFRDHRPGEDGAKLQPEDGDDRESGCCETRVAGRRARTTRLRRARPGRTARAVPRSRSPASCARAPPPAARQGSAPAARGAPLYRVPTPEATRAQSKTRSPAAVRARSSALKSRPAPASSPHSRRRCRRERRR